MTPANTGHRRKNGVVYCKACNRISAHAGNRTHCLEGHRLTPDNVVLTRKGFRKCRTCRETQGIPTVGGNGYRIRGEITIEIRFGDQSLGRFIVRVPPDQLEAVG